MCSHWSCLCSSYRALHSVEEKRGSWQEQGSKETLAEVWSRRVSVASAQSSPFSGPRGWIWKQCSRRPWRRFDCTSNHSLGAVPGPHNLLYLHYFLCPRSLLCPHCLLSPHHLLSLEAACGLHPPPAVYWAQLTVLSLPPLPTTWRWSVFLCLCFQVHSRSSGKPQFLTTDLILNFLEKLHGERLGSHLTAQAWGLAPVRPSLWAEFPLDRPRAPLQLLTLQGEG